MGVFKQSKQNSAASDAQRAAGEGHRVFVYQIRQGMSHTPNFSQPVGDTAEIIEGIESAGWRMDGMSALLYNDRATLYCMFRRDERHAA